MLVAPSTKPLESRPSWRNNPAIALITIFSTVIVGAIVGFEGFDALGLGSKNVVSPVFGHELWLTLLMIIPVELFLLFYVFNPVMTVAAEDRKIWLEKIDTMTAKELADTIISDRILEGERPDVDVETLQRVAKRLKELAWWSGAAEATA